MHGAIAEKDRMRGGKLGVLLFLPPLPNPLPEGEGVKYRLKGRPIYFLASGVLIRDADIIHHLLDMWRWRGRVA